jgi:hypothetical protein
MRQQWIFGVRSKIFRVYPAMALSLVPILGVYAVSLYDDFSGEWA